MTNTPNTTTDRELLTTYLAAGEHSHDAFRTLTTRYVGLIYSTARRQAPPHLAEDITQAVFLLLAQKAKTLRNPELLPAWLLQTTRFCAAAARRQESRRRRREQEIAAMAPSETPAPADLDPDILAPHLDAALHSLSQTDRTALLLRYYNDHSIAQVASALNLSEEAAKKRLSRALEKLRKLFARKNLTLAAPLLATTLARQSHAAPPTLAANCATAALTQSTTPAATLIAKGALKLMAYTTAKLATATAVAVLLLTTATAAVLHQQTIPIAAPPPTPAASGGAGPSASIIIATSSTRTIPHDPIPTIEVLDLATNAPIPNVHLRLVKDLTYHDLGTAGTTDASGKATIPYPVTADWGGEVLASADGYVPIRSGWSRLLPSDPAPDHILLHLEKAVTIGGRVLDADGNPLPGATVLPSPIKKYAEFTSAWNFATATTDADGNWSLAVAPENGDVRIGASHPSSLTNVGQMRGDPALFSELKNRTHVIRLPRATPVSGTVFGPDGKTIKATLSIGTYTGAENALPNIQTTDDGRFQFAVVPNDVPLIITTRSNGLAIATTSLPLDATPIHADISLAPQKPLTAHITDNHNNPVSNALITIISWNTNDKYVPQTFPAAFISDQNGNITWPDAPAQPVLANISAPGCLSRQNVPLDRNADNIIALLPRTIIHIHPVSAATGKPITEAWPYQSNPDEYRALPDGTLELAMYWQNDKNSQFILHGPRYLPSDPVQFPLDGHDYDITIPLHEADPITGQLVDSEGSPLPNTLIWLSTDSHRAVDGGQYPFDPISIKELPHSYATTDNDGNFSFPPESVPYFLLVATDKGYSLASTKQFQKNNTLTLAPWSALDGTFQRPGAPTLSGVTITLQRLGSPNLTYSALTNATGHFSIPHIIPGSYSTITDAYSLLGHWSASKTKLRPAQTTTVTLTNQ